jgi:hypothetical protein
MNKQKKYRTPSVTQYGPVEEITRDADLDNSDGQGNDTAFPNPSS